MLLIDSRNGSSRVLKASAFSAESCGIGAALSVSMTLLKPPTGGGMVAKRFLKAHSAASSFSISARAISGFLDSAIARSKLDNEPRPSMNALTMLDMGHRSFSQDARSRLANHDFFEGRARAVKQRGDRIGILAQPIGDLHHVHLLHVAHGDHRGLIGGELRDGVAQQTALLSSLDDPGFPRGTRALQAFLSLSHGTGEDGRVFLAHVAGDVLRDAHEAACDSLGVI